MAVEHKGILEYTGDEVSNIFLGQTGFDMLRNASGDEHWYANGHNGGSGTTNLDEGGSGSTAHINVGVTYWVALKAVGGSCVLNARSILPGDDFNTSGSYASSGDITLSDGDIIYGAFDAITITGSNQELIAYRGK